MSRRTATVDAGGGGRSAVAALLLVAVAIGMMLLVRAHPDTQPFDPRSGSPDGTRGLVLLLEQQGATVDIVGDAPQPGEDVRVLVLADRLNDGQRRDLLQFVDQGGVVVMADPQSPLLGSLGSTSSIRMSTPYGNTLEAEIDVPLGECTVGSLAHLRGLFVANGVLFSSQNWQRECFSEGGEAFLTVHQIGAGVVVQLGDKIGRAHV